LDEWLMYTADPGNGQAAGAIPILNLEIGNYEDDIPALLNLNGRNIPNTQILVAGTTGSGKSNLLAVIINEIRQISLESAYPVNFFLFDYKGEFSDPANNDWLSLFEVDRTAILDPIKAPLPFTPFKDFTGKAQNEINLYSTEMANALCAIDNTRISANMSNRLSEAIINSYKRTSNKPLSFDLMLKEYTALQPDRDRENNDSIKSVLKQLIRNNLFELEDKVDLIKESFIVKMDSFPKEGPIAKAIVYFIVSKLNIIYEKLSKQAVDDACVEIRHFTIIDEAHYMLGFDNKPLRDLIAVGRNKGLSIILATQNMDSFKSDYFDFYANAQYPLIMKQQSINDGVIRDLFGVSGNEFNEIKQAIAGLQLGELIIKNPTAIALGIGKKYKKIKVRHLI
jgi:DNA helicase HerA-like ATPase